MVPLVTPLAADEALDDAGLRRLVRRCLDDGVDALLALGTTGEAAQLADDVRRAALELVVAEAGGRVSVFAGCSDTGTLRTLRRCEDAAACGADFALVCPPFYFVCDDAGTLLRYFRDVADGSPLPVVIYNIPQFAGAAVDVDTVAELSHHPNIVGVKDSSGEGVERLTSRVGEGFALYEGDESRALAALEAGAWGVVPSSANVAGGLWCALRDAAASGEGSKAARLAERLERLCDLYTFSTVFAVIKGALQMLGVCSSVVTRPHPSSDAVDAERLAEVLSGLGLV